MMSHNQACCFYSCQNAHAYVNAGFRAVVDSGFTIQGTPSLVFGGVKLSPVGSD